MEECFTLPRIEYCKHIDGFSMGMLNSPVEKGIVRQLLPAQLYWINTQGAFVNPNTGFSARTHYFPLTKHMILANEPFIDGPYLSKEHMRSCSPAYNLIIKPDPLKAAEILVKIIQRRRGSQFIHEIKNDFLDNLPYILEHTFVGHNRGGKVTGVHFYTSDVRRRAIIGNLKCNSPLYIIEKVDPLTREAFLKNAATTFWPEKWNIEKCVTECAITWNNKTPSSMGRQYTGYTSTGLRIVFCFSGKKLKTIYPDFSNNEYH